MLPRLCLLIALVTTCRLCLDGAVKWAITSGGEAALGAKVEIANLDTALLRGELTIRDFAAANPSAPMRNLIAASEANLMIDVGELCRGRLLVTGGAVRGIEFDGQRTESGALPATDDLPDAPGPSVFDPLVAAAEEKGAAWLDDVTGRLETDLESQLQTPRVAQELQDRWPQEYDAMRAAIDDIQTRGKQIETEFKEAKKNPLRNAAKFQTLAGDVTTLEQRVQALQARLAALPQQADADRQAIDAARKHDQEFVRQTLQIKDLDGDQLSRYLLGEETYGYVSTTLAWVQRARELVPSKKPHAKPPKGRGVEVKFVDTPRPTVLVERMELFGNARLRGQPLELAGLLTDAASQPQFHSEPMRLELTGAGALACSLQVTCDRRTDEATDTLQFDCPELPLPGRTLGKAEKLAVSVAPGAASLTAHLQLVGDEIVGTIEYAQPSTQLTASAAAVRDARLTDALNKSLASLQRVQATVAVTGNVQRPDVKLTSNLGPDLAAGFNQAFRAYLTEKADRLVAKAQAKVDEQVARLDAKRQAAQQELLGKLGGHQQLLAQLGSLTGGQLPAGVQLPGGVVLPANVAEGAAGVQNKAAAAAAAKLGELQGKFKR